MREGGPPAQNVYAIPAIGCHCCHPPPLHRHHYHSPPAQDINADPAIVVCHSPPHRHPSCWVLDAEASPQQFWGSWAEEEGGPGSMDGGSHALPYASGAAAQAGDATTSAEDGAVCDAQPSWRRKLNPSGTDFGAAPTLMGGSTDDVSMSQQQEEGAADLKMADPADPAGCSTSGAGGDEVKTEPGCGMLARPVGPSVEQVQEPGRGRPQHRQWWQAAGPSHAGFQGATPSSWSDDDLPRYDDLPRCGGCSFLVAFPKVDGAVGTGLSHACSRCLIMLCLCNLLCPCSRSSSC